MESTCCLLNFDGINYKIDFHLKNGETKIDLNYLKKNIGQNDEELAQLNILEDDKYIFEIFDARFQEYVQADENTEIHDRTKIRVRTMKNNNLTPIANGNDHIDQDEVLLVKDLEDKKDLVNIVAKLHLSFVNTTNHNRRRKSNHILEENLKMKEKFWSTVAEEMAISRNKNFDTEQCMVMFFALLSQYQYILRKYKRFTEERIQDMWSFFKAFHHKIDCKLFSKGFSTLKNNFNNHRKEGHKGKNHHKKNEYSRLEEDFNLITSIINRHNSFRKPPRVAVWKIISDDMNDYNLPNSRMSAFRWQKRFHELLKKYLQISSQDSQLEKDTWPLYNLFTQIDLDLFVKTPDKKTKTKTGRKSPVPIDLSDSESEFVVIDEITAESDQEAEMIDLEEEEELEECVQEVVNELIDRVLLKV